MRMGSGLISESNEFTVIDDWVDEVMVTASSLSFDEFVLFVLSGKTFNESSPRRSLGVVVTSISGDNDDDVAGWEGAFVFDCNDNVVISETGVESVVTVNRRNERKEDENHEKKAKMNFPQDSEEGGHQMTREK